MTRRRQDPHGLGAGPGRPARARPARASLPRRRLRLDHRQLVGRWPTYATPTPRSPSGAGPARPLRAAGGRGRREEALPEGLQRGARLRPGLPRPERVRDRGADAGGVRVRARAPHRLAAGSHQLYIVPRAFAEANAYYSREDRGDLLRLPAARRGEHGLHLPLARHRLPRDDPRRARRPAPALPRAGAARPGRLPRGAGRHRGAAFGVLAAGGARAAARQGRRERPHPDERVHATRRSPRACCSASPSSSARRPPGVRGSALRRSRELEPGERVARRPGVRRAAPPRRGAGGGRDATPCVEDLGRRGCKRDRARRRGSTGARPRGGGQGGRPPADDGRSGRSTTRPPSSSSSRTCSRRSSLRTRWSRPTTSTTTAARSRRASRRFDIHRPDGPHRSTSRAAGTPFRYDQVNAAALRTEQAGGLPLHLAEPRRARARSRTGTLEVESLRPAVRVGPDGLVVQEVVCDYSQVLELTAGQARAARPARARSSTFPTRRRCRTRCTLQFWGGGTLIFDQFGRAKFHQRKDLERLDAPVQAARLPAPQGPVRQPAGGSVSPPARRAGMAFADMHAPDDRAGEAW